MRKSLIVIILVFFAFTGQSQEKRILDKTVNIELSNQNLAFYIELIEKQCHINFSYNTDEIPLKTRIYLPLGEQSLEVIFNHLRIKHNISATVVNELIILKKAKQFTISGYVKDAKSGEFLISASIYEILKYVGTSSNNYGFYSITLTEGWVKLRISYVGYTTQTKDIYLKSDTVLNIDLKPGIGLKEVSVYSTQDDRDFNSGVGIERLAMKTVSELPAFGGEADILKAIEFLPGVQLGSEASTGLVVRGGSPEQNLLLLDGIPVYNANHAFGLFSVFNSDAIKNVSLLKGGFPSRYGGRLSSVIDVRMKEGNLNEYHGNFQIGVVASKFSIEGPIVKGKSSFIVSGRRTYFDIFLPKKSKSEDEVPSFFFYDFNAKVNTQISNKDKLYLSAYLGHDKFILEEHDTFQDGNDVFVNEEDISSTWGNKTLLLRWNHLFNNKLFGNLSLLKSLYNLTIHVTEYDYANEEHQYNSNKYKSGIDDFALKIDFDFYPFANHALKFGTEYIRHEFNPGSMHSIYQNYYLEGRDRVYTPNGNLNETAFNDIVFADEVRAYLEDDFKIADKHHINLGVHYSGFSVHSKYYSSIEPRVSYSYLLNNKTALKTSYTKMYQYIHLLTQSSMGMPTDLWLPVTDDVKPQSAHQITAGLNYKPNKHYELEIEAYYKQMNDLYAYKDGVDYLSANNIWEESITTGHGSSYGLEFLLRKKTGRLKGWLSYTYSKTERQFAIINDGEPFPYKYDRTHQMNVVANYKLSDKTSFNATWIYATGMAYTLADEKYASLFNIYRWNSPESSFPMVDNVSQRNNKRLNSYHRLDLSFTFIKKREKTNHIWQMGAYNAYARFNPYLIYWDNDWDEISQSRESRRLKHVTLFTIIPFISYRLEF